MMTFIKDCDYRAQSVSSLFKRFSWRLFFGSLLQVFGALWLLVEIIDYFFSSLVWASSIKTGWWIFGVSGLVIGIVRAWPSSTAQARIQGTDVIVEVKIGDLFKLDGAIVVGSNTTFDTSMDDNTIAPTSIQGQFTDRYFSTITELDQKLAAALSSSTVVGTKTQAKKPYGKRAEYQLGTVAPIETSDRKAYFVAIARLSSQRAIESDANSLLDALPLMWNGIRERAGIENLVCPILGSGHSRLSLTRRELIQAIIRSFVAATQEGKLTEKLTVVICPQDAIQGCIGLEDLQKFLEYECVYAQVPNASRNAPPKGTPV